MKVSLPVTSLVQQMLAPDNAKGGNLDHSAIVTFIEQMAHGGQESRGCQGPAMMLPTLAMQLAPQMSGVIRWRA
jgi:hypothetical protein